MFADLDWLINAWRGLSAIAEFLFLQIMKYAEDKYVCLYVCIFPHDKFKQGSPSLVRTHVDLETTADVAMTLGP